MVVLGKKQNKRDYDRALHKEVLKAKLVFKPIITYVKGDQEKRKKYLV